MMTLLVGMLMSALLLPAISVEADDPPTLIITKTVTPTTVGLGETVTVTITITGFTENGLSPRSIAVHEGVSDDFVVDMTSFTKPIYGVDTFPGILAITWRNIAQDVGNADIYLDATETWSVQYQVRPTAIGTLTVGGVPSQSVYLLVPPPLPEPIHFVDMPQAPLTVLFAEPSIAFTRLKNIIEELPLKFFKEPSPLQADQLKRVLQSKLDIVIALFEGGYTTAAHNKLMNDIAPKLADPWLTPTRARSWLTRNPKYAHDVKGYSKLCYNLIKLQPEPSPQ